MDRPRATVSRASALYRSAIMCEPRLQRSNLGRIMLSASTIGHNRVTRLLVSAITLLCAMSVSLFAQDLETRAGRLQQERQAKSQQLQPYKRNGLESLLFELKDRRIMERYQAGYKGFHPMLGGLATGSGFALGTQFRKTGIAGGLLNFQTSRSEEHTSELQSLRHLVC